MGIYNGKEKHKYWFWKSNSFLSKSLCLYSFLIYRAIIIFIFINVQPIQISRGTEAIGVSEGPIGKVCSLASQERKYLQSNLDVKSQAK